MGNFCPGNSDFWPHALSPRPPPLTLLSPVPYLWALLWDPGVGGETSDHTPCISEGLGVGLELREGEGENVGGEAEPGGG